MQSRTPAAPEELVVDLKPYRSEGIRSAKVFIADALDNGAGYAVEGALRSSPDC